MNHKMLRPFIVKVSVLGYFTLDTFSIAHTIPRLNISETNVRLVYILYIYIYTLYILI